MIAARSTSLFYAHAAAAAVYAYAVYARRRAALRPDAPCAAPVPPPLGVTEASALSHLAANAITATDNAGNKCSAEVFVEPCCCYFFGNASQQRPNPKGGEELRCRCTAQRRATRALRSAATPSVRSSSGL